MSDRVALVTGSTSGIGAAIARRLAREGYAVALHSRRRSADAGRAMAAELPGASYHQADLGDEAATRDLVAAVVQHHGRLDVLVNNAGESIRIPHADLKAATPAVWRRMLDINLIAPFVLIAEAEPALRKSAESGRPACIVNIGTHAGVRPKGASIPYAAAKAGLHHATRLLALAWGPPSGSIAWRRASSRRRWARIGPRRPSFGTPSPPMRRAARPEDIADLVAALCANDYVTGEIVIADGGLNLT